MLDLQRFIPQLVDWAVQQGVQGLIIDYEPSPTPASNLVDLYVHFLSALSAAMRPHGVKIVAELSSTGILHDYGAYVSAVDAVTTTAGWYGAFDGNLTRLIEESVAVVSEGFAVSRIHFGLSTQCSPICHWTPAFLHTWLGFVTAQAYAGIDVWAPNNNITTWEWDTLRHYRNGTLN